MKFKNEALSVIVAGQTDVPAILSLVNSAYRGAEARKGWTHEADLLEGDMRIDADTLVRMIGEKNSAILVAKQDGMIVGCVHVKQQGGRQYLGLLSVHPEVQGRGMGKRLLQAAEDHARQHGAATIYMTVISVRQPLIEWYERHGYKANGRSVPFEVDPRFGVPTQPLHFIELEKTVSPVDSPDTGDTRTA